MKSIRVHHCFQQELGETQPKKCRCRKYIPVSEAIAEVSSGLAQWVILGKFLTDRCVEYTCNLCCGDAILKKSCQNCKGEGIIKDPIYKEIISDSDIVAVTVTSQDGEGKLTHRSSLAVQTPRVATLERAHIERAFVDQRKDEQDRVEAYGELCKEFIRSLVWLVPEGWVDLTEGELLFPFGPDQRTVCSYHDGLRERQGNTRIQ